jgi:hypothetical protein
VATAALTAESWAAAGSPRLRAAPDATVEMAGAASAVGVAARLGRAGTVSSAVVQTAAAHAVRINITSMTDLSRRRGAAFRFHVPFIARQVP